MISPKAIANFFIQQAINENNSMTPMKLLKLVYLAHGWHLGLTKEELIEEEVYAWRYGPVVTSVYHEFKPYGTEKIDRLASETKFILSDTGKFIFQTNIPTVDNVGDGTKKVLDIVWASYKRYTGLQLSSITHKPNSPWDIVWNQQGGKNIRSAVIPNELIKDYYMKRAEELKVTI